MFAQLAGQKHIVESDEKPQEIFQENRQRQEENHARQRAGQNFGIPRILRVGGLFSHLGDEFPDRSDNT
jgi:cell fate (sporulation/competence/biofilm development) regulator YlbF (YheA/YmcA/DUF963 family)